MENTITHDKLLGAVETKTFYKKRNKNTRYMNVISKDIADAWESTVRKVHESIDTEKVKLGVDEKYHPETRKMLRKHNDRWSGTLGNVNIMQEKSNSYKELSTLNLLPTQHVQ